MPNNHTDADGGLHDNGDHHGDHAKRKSFLPKCKQHDGKAIIPAVGKQQDLRACRLRICIPSPQPPNNRGNREHRELDESDIGANQQRAVVCDRGGVNRPEDESRRQQVEDNLCESYRFRSNESPHQVSASADDEYGKDNIEQNDPIVTPPHLR